MDFGKNDIAESETARHEKVADFSIHAYSTAPGCKSLLEHYLKINKNRKINDSQQVCWKSCCDTLID